MEEASYNVLLFIMGVGLAFLLYFLWKHFTKKSCGCSQTPVTQ